MFGLGTPELLVIMAIAFLLFGGKKLPEIGAGLGKGIASFKKGLREVESSSKAAMEENIPGVAEVAAIKEEVKKVKEIN